MARTAEVEVADPGSRERALSDLAIDTLGTHQAMGAAGLARGAAAGLGAAHEHTREANANGSGLLGSQ